MSDRLLVLGGLLGVGLGLAFWAAGPWLPRLFTDDPVVILAVAGVLPFVAAMQPLNAVVFVWDGIYMGVEDFGYLAVAMIVSALVAGVLLAAVLPFGWGLHGVWWALVGLMVARGATMAWRYRPAVGLFRRKAA